MFSVCVVLIYVLGNAKWWKEKGFFVSFQASSLKQKRLNVTILDAVRFITRRCITSSFEVSFKRDQCQHLLVQLHLFSYPYTSICFFLFSYMVKGM